MLKDRRIHAAKARGRGRGDLSPRACSWLQVLQRGAAVTQLKGEERKYCKSEGSGIRETSKISPVWNFCPSVGVFFSSYLVWFHEVGLLRWEFAIGKFAIWP